MLKLYIDIDTIERLVTALLAALASILGFINNKHIKDVHIAVNSRLSQFIEVVEKAQFAKGVKQEQEDHAKIIKGMQDMTQALPVKKMESE